MLVACLIQFIATAQWISKDPVTSTNASLYSIFFTSSSTGFVVGKDDNGGLILKTTNGGDTWVSYPALPYSFTKVYFTSKSTGYLSGVDNNGGIILKTTDGGTTWRLLQSPTTAFSYYNIHFTDSINGFINGIHGTIYKSSDSGSTWSTIPGSSWGLGSVNSMFFASPTTGYVFGSNVYGGIQKTTNSGSTWVTQAHPTTTTLRSAYFINASEGWVVGDSGTILKTSDGGAKWEQQVSGTNEKLQSVHFSKATNGVIVGQNGIILKTIDGGTTWFSQLSNTTESLNSVHLLDRNVAYVTGNKNTIRMTRNGGGYPLSMDHFDKNEIKVYPNPSNRLFALKSNTQILDLCIKNSLGQTIYSKSINKLRVEIDLDKHPNGIYFLIVSTSNGIIVSKINLMR